MSLDTGINIVSLAELKSFIEGNTSSSTEFDSRYEELINVASVMINNYTGRHIKASTFTSDYDGPDSEELYLKNYPISSTALTVCIDENRAFTTDLNVTSTGIIIYYDEGRIVLDNDWFDEGKANVRVAYTGGYSSSSMPYDLKRAACELATFFWGRESKRDRIGIRNESLEGQSRTFETDMPWSVKKILDNYREGRF
jgi:hypothetical protein